MAWIAHVQPDEDKTDIGTATVIWNQGLADEFTFTKRTKVSVAAAEALKAEAEAAQAEAIALAQRSANLSAILEGIMNDG